MPIVEQLQADREKQLERQKTIEENIGLVHACAHRFQGKGIEYDDLFQAGCMGLVKATDAFDTGRGVRFSTYAVPVILGEMRRLFRDGGTVKVSRSLKELGMKLNRCREQFAREHGREATITELAQQLQVTQEAVVEALGANSPPVSLTSSEDSSEVDLPVSSPEELSSLLVSETGGLLAPSASTTASWVTCSCCASSVMVASRPCSRANCSRQRLSFIPSSFKLRLTLTVPPSRNSRRISPKITGTA